MVCSTLDPDNMPPRRGRKTVKGTDVKSLGPSDTSDSGSDMAGPGTVGKIEAGASVGDREMDDTSDASGTGEHLTAGKEPRGRTNADRDTDRVVKGDEAGLGGGLDQAEEARLKKPKP
ncbi:MAG TPA: chemotaxis protein [Burkholderiales bacterium]|nr:chemotaxis protein [Burkholderiales bacterium]